MDEMIRGEGKGFKRRSVGRIAVLAALLVGMLGGTVFGASTVKKYHDIPAYQMRDVYSQKQVKIGPIDVFNGRYSSDKPVDYDVTFTIYNSTLQKIDQVVTTKDGKLPELSLTEGFNYIFMVLDNSRWYMANRYYWVHKGNLCNIKSYEPNLKELQKRKGEDYKPTDKERENCYDRVNSITVMPFNNQSDSTDRLNGNRNDNIYVYYQGKEAEAGINIVFTSDRETVTAKTDKYGRVQPILLEDVNYMVSTDDPRYEIDPFPIAVKDKSEYSDSKIWSYVNRFFYDHSTCHRVGLRYQTFDKEKQEMITVTDEPITLLDKGQAHKHDKPLTSLSGNVTVEGMQFKDIVLLDRKVNRDIPELGEKDYRVMDITTVNPHRGEICKLASGDFTVTTSSFGRTVDNVYRIDANGALQECDFEQKNGKVRFHVNALPAESVVLEYSNEINPVLKLSATAYTYNGKVRKPSVAVKAGEKTFSASEFAVKYSGGRKNVGKYSVTVTMKGKYTGKKTVTFRINPKGTAVQKLTKGRKQMKVTWKAQKTQVSGYRIQYSTSSKFKKGTHIKTVKSYKTKSLKVKKLKAKKKYYVRIQTYKTVGGIKYYSGWSKTKSVKTK
ncbi:hypothetical protein FYJ65_05945 [Clostridiales Family XIII bacterium WCA-MUC-591-APC-4B]|uniref:Fibronectin type-III domain-containing protein n=2 Tax=Mogibacterium kristiansenii TaxID=2606708 RepID=A0A6N7XLR0_9FIRM|nr:hypothetical protein [Mogibacterium kristiansenii]